MNNEKRFYTFLGYVFFGSSISQALIGHIELAVLMVLYSIMFFVQIK